MRDRSVHVEGGECLVRLRALMRILADKDDHSLVNREIAELHRTGCQANPRYPRLPKARSERTEVTAHSTTR